MVRVGLIVAAALILCGPAYGQEACSPACDLNGDKLPKVTVQDYAVFLAAFGKKAGDAGYSAAADFDGNGTVTAADFGTFSKFCPLR